MQSNSSRGVVRYLPSLLVYCACLVADLYIWCCPCGRLGPPSELQDSGAWQSAPWCLLATGMLVQPFCLGHKPVCTHTSSYSRNESRTYCEFITPPRELTPPFVCRSNKLVGTIAKKAAALKVRANPSAGFNTSVSGCSTLVSAECVVHKETFT